MPEDLTVHIYPSDCDSVGHVNHAHMLTLLERARWAALESKMTYAEYMKSKLWAVVRKVEASYHARGGKSPKLPGRADLVKGGRADVRFSIDANGELFLYSKGDGVIRAVVEAIGF